MRTTWTSVFFFLSVVICVHLTSAASVLDWFSWDYPNDEESEVAQRDDGDEASSTLTTDANYKDCKCEGTGCNCCVHFNFSFIDLGGPGCVKMKYISPDEGIAVNVSYGDSLLHSEAVKGANPDPTCMDMLSDLAQFCARFVDLAPTSQGLRWCLQLEPTFLGDVQAEYHVGCFRMDQDGMYLDPTYNATRPSSLEPQTAPQQPAQPINEEALLAAVNESAQEGIAFFTKLFGLLDPDADTSKNSTSTEQPDEGTTPSATVPEPSESRSGRSKFQYTRSPINEI